MQRIGSDVPILFGSNRMPIAAGTRLGQYEVQDYIGQGAMGVVYRAYHPQLARTGAVKVLQALSPDLDSTARFRREAQAIASSATAPLSVSV